MSDRRESTRPVLVVFQAHDANSFPVREYTKEEEFDREEWNQLDGEGRRELVATAFNDWLNETFGLDYQIVSDDDYDDESGED